MNRNHSAAKKNILSDDSNDKANLRKYHGEQTNEFPTTTQEKKEYNKKIYSIASVLRKKSKPKILPFDYFGHNENKNGVRSTQDDSYSTNHSNKISHYKDKYQRRSLKSADIYLIKKRYFIKGSKWDSDEDYDKKNYKNLSNWDNSFDKKSLTVYSEPNVFTNKEAQTFYTDFDENNKYHGYFHTDEFRNDRAPYISNYNERPAIRAATQPAMQTYFNKTFNPNIIDHNSLQKNILKIIPVQSSGLVSENIGNRIVNKKVIDYDLMDYSNDDEVFENSIDSIYLKINNSNYQPNHEATMELNSNSARDKKTDYRTLDVQKRLVKNKSNGKSYDKNEKIKRIKRNDSFEKKKKHKYVKKDEKVEENFENKKRSRHFEDIDSKQLKTVSPDFVESNEKRSKNIKNKRKKYELKNNEIKDEWPRRPKQTHDEKTKKKSRSNKKKRDKSKVISQDENTVAEPDDDTSRLETETPRENLQQEKKKCTNKCLKIILIVTVLVILLTVIVTVLLSLYVGYIVKFSFGDSCIGDYICNTDQLLKCINYICTCDSNYRYSNITKTCISSTSTTLQG